MINLGLFIESYFEKRHALSRSSLSLFSEIASWCELVNTPRVHKLIVVDKGLRHPAYPNNLRRHVCAASNLTSSAAFADTRAPSVRLVILLTGLPCTASCDAWCWCQSILLFIHRRIIYLPTLAAYNLLAASACFCRYIAFANFATQTICHNNVRERVIFAQRKEFWSVGGATI